MPTNIRGAVCQRCTWISAFPPWCSSTRGTPWKLATTHIITNLFPLIRFCGVIERSSLSYCRYSLDSYMVRARLPLLHSVRRSKGCLPTRRFTMDRTGHWFQSGGERNEWITLAPFEISSLSSLSVPKSTPPVWRPRSRSSHRSRIGSIVSTIFMVRSCSLEANGGQFQWSIEKQWIGSFRLIRIYYGAKTWVMYHLFIAFAKQRTMIHNCSHNQYNNLERVPQRQNCRQIKMALWTQVH